MTRAPRSMGRATTATMGSSIVAAGCLLALATPAAADASGPSSIIGGTTAKPGQYPSVVAIRIGGDLCTGTLVSPVWVLTAAHCIDPAVIGLPTQDQVTANVRVHFDTLDLSVGDGRVVRASQTSRDPQFNKDRLGTNDIGLIKLAEAVTDIEPSPVNFSADKVPVGTTVTMVGFGSTEHGGTGTVGVEFELPDHVSVSCPTLGIGANANLLCFSQTDNTGTCLGDSGGPSFAMIDGRRTVVAVTSFGDSQCAEFGAATRTDIERSFLTMVAPELLGCTRDADCGASRTCFARRCIADPFGPRGIGTACASAVDCESSQCAESSQDGKRCSMVCSVSDEATCPDGFDCLRANGDVGACWPNGSGGCCDAGRGGPGAMLAGFAVLGLAVRRRRA
jgi:hypothetical protein